MRALPGEDTAPPPTLPHQGWLLGIRKAWHWQKNWRRFVGMAFCSLSATSAPLFPSFAILQVFLPVFPVLLFHGITLQPCCHQGAQHSAPRCFTKPQQHLGGLPESRHNLHAGTPEYPKPGLVCALCVGCTQIHLAWKQAVGLDLGCGCGSSHHHALNLHRTHVELLILHC